MHRVSSFFFLLCFSLTSWAQDYVRDEVIVKFKSHEDISIDNHQRMTAKRMVASQTLAVIGVGDAQQLMPLTAQKEAEAKMRKAQGIAPKREQLVPAWKNPRGTADVSQLYVLKIDTTQTSVPEAIELLNALEEVEYAEPNRIWKRNNVIIETQTEEGIAKQRKVATAEAIDYAATDELFEQQWNLQAVRLPELWEQPIIHERRPIIAIIDTGCDTTHVDLKDNLLPGFVPRDGSTNVWEPSYENHGTATASIAAAVGGNGGMVGANPLAQIIPIKTSTYTEDYVIKALDYAIAHGADVISCSYGAYISSQAESEAFQKASESAVIVAAAGNEGWNLEQIDGDFPACYPGVFSVMGTTPQGLMSQYNYDPNGAFYAENVNNYNYQLKAPGINILTANRGGGYHLLSGTSFATPLVAGAISRLLQCRDYNSREELLQALVESQGSHLDIMEAYHYKEPISGLFTRNICGQDIVFRKTGENSVEIGDGVNPCCSGEYKVFFIPDVVAGYAVTTIAPGALKGLKAQTVILPYMLNKLDSQTFAEAQMDTLRVENKLFSVDCATDAFTPSQYADCVLACKAPSIDKLLSSPVWSQFRHTTFERFTKNQDGIDILYVVTDQKAKTVQVGDGTESAISKTTQGTLTIPEEVYGHRVTNVAREAFFGCHQLTEAILPNSVTEIGKYAFYNCTSLVSVIMPEDLEVFPGYLFCNCASLTSIQWPKTLKVLEDQCLWESGMKEIIVPDGVIEIRWYALSCSFTKCVLPKSITSLGLGCLASSNPYVLVVENPEPISLIVTDFFGEEAYEDVFGDYVEQSTLVVPEGSKAAYEDAVGWSDFGCIVEETAETVVTNIKNLNQPGENLSGEKERWYTLQGVRLKDKPSTKGVYLHGARKIYIQ